MAPRKVDILQPLFERLKSSAFADVPNALVYGLPYGFGDNPNPVAVSIIQYKGEETHTLASKYLPYGFGVIGLVEFEEEDEDAVDIFPAVQQLEFPVLFRINRGKITASTGLDFLEVLHLNVISSQAFWEKSVCTFRIRGEFLLTSVLELPELQKCLEFAVNRVHSQAAFTVGKQNRVTILPRNGDVIVELPSLKGTANEKVSDVVKALKDEINEANDKTSTFFCPGLCIIDVKLLQDQTKSNAVRKSTILVSDKNARCKYFEHYVGIDTLLVVPATMTIDKLYKKFNLAICTQLKHGFFSNIEQQLANSITAELPIVYHFWPPPVQHFLTVVYPEHTSEEKLKEIRFELHDLLYIKPPRPFFRRPAALFQDSLSGLISPHVSLSAKFPQTQLIDGHYEYRHYMQQDFNDDGWGCAYRSLQTIVSWFRLQGFTSAPVPTHKEIQECLVSLGDKQPAFVNSKQWIGSTEVGFVLEALLGVSCRILSMSSGSEMSSKAAELESHFKVHGTPCMVGGGQYAHTIIGVSRDPEKEAAVNYLILDPHFTGKDDLKTVLNKGWVGWKEDSFWSKKDFYNICMPLLPSSI